jgi:hypothetical protein
VDSNAERLSGCLSRNLPLPDPATYIPANYPADFREWLAVDLFAGGLLLSAGMFGNEPQDVHPAFLMYRQNPGLYERATERYQAYANLYSASDRAKQVNDADLSRNCGLVVIRRLVRSEPAIAGLLAWGVVEPMVGGFRGGQSTRRTIADAVDAYKVDPTGYPEDLLLRLGKAAGIMRSE